MLHTLKDLNSHQSDLESAIIPLYQECVYVPREGLEPPTYAGYRIYSPAPFPAEQPWNIGGSDGN